MDSFFDDAFARMRHLYSSGVGNGGRPSRGEGRSYPSSEELNESFIKIKSSAALSRNGCRKHSNTTYIVSLLCKLVLICYLHCELVILIAPKTKKIITFVIIGLKRRLRFATIVGH